MSANVKTPRINPLLEAIFTSEWSAIYDPVSRERWDIAALLDESLYEPLNAKEHLQPGIEEALREAGMMADDQTGTQAARAWCEAGWREPLRHYLHTNLLPKLGYENREGWLEDFSTMRRKVEKSPIPELTKRYVDSPRTVDLPLDGELESIARLTKTSLAKLLINTFGVTGHKSLAVTGRHIRRTSPSGGSRHPTEAYVLVFDVEGLTPGVYHFDSENRQLAQIREGQYRSLYMEEVAGLNRRIGFTPTAAVVLTSIAERSMHRYRDSRSYRVLHFDLGHLLRTLQLLTQSLGIPYFGAYSLGDTQAERLLKVDGLMESAMCQFILG